MALLIDIGQKLESDKSYFFYYVCHLVIIYAFFYLGHYRRQDARFLWWLSLEFDRTTCRKRLGIMSCIEFDYCVSEMTCQMAENRCKRQIAQKRVYEWVVKLEENQKYLTCDISYKWLLMVIKFLHDSKQWKVWMTFVCKKINCCQVNFQRQRSKKVN